MHLSRKHLISAVICLIFTMTMVTVTATTILTGAGDAERVESDNLPVETETALQGEIAALRNEVKNLSQIISTQQSQISELRGMIEGIQFKINPDIELTAELQEYAYWECVRAGVDYELMLKLMQHESRFQVNAVGYNTNGTRDYGLCQINEVNHAWLLRDHGLNVHDPRDNISAGVLIVSMWQEKYPDDVQALACYAAGEQGMLSGGGYRRAREILETEI